MNRDLDIIREIMVAVKEADTFVKKVDGMPDDVFKFHAMLLVEAGLADGMIQRNTRKSSPIPSSAIISRLTWQGFEFADMAKDGKFWEKSKRFIAATVGTTAFEIVFDYIKQVTKAKLGLDGPV